MFLENGKPRVTVHRQGLGALTRTILICRGDRNEKYIDLEI